MQEPIYSDNSTVVGDGTPAHPLQDTARLTQVASGDGPVNIHSGTVLITKPTAAALTLSQPIAGTDDGKLLRFVPVTAQAHTITTAANGINGNKHIATLVPPSSGLFVAYQGVWYNVTNQGATLS